MLHNLKLQDGVLRRPRAGRSRSSLGCLRQVPRILGRCLPESASYSNSPPPRSSVSHLTCRRFQKLEVIKVNTYGLVLRWQGSDQSLLPVLLAAHQGKGHKDSYSPGIHRYVRADVVPVEPSTAKDWKHPPYSGHYDGGDTSPFYRFCN